MSSLFLDKWEQHFSKDSSLPIDIHFHKFRQIILERLNGIDLLSGGHLSICSGSGSLLLLQIHVIHLVSSFLLHISGDSSLSLLSSTSLVLHEHIIHSWLSYTWHHGHVRGHHHSIHGHLRHSSSVSREHVGVHHHIILLVLVSLISSSGFFISRILILLYKIVKIEALFGVEISNSLLFSCLHEGLSGIFLIFEVDKTLLGLH